MELYYLLKKEIKEPVLALFIFTMISGISSAILISLINMAAENASNSEVNNRLFVLFACGVIVVLFAKKYVLNKSAIIVETTMRQLRNRVANKIRHTELNILETIGPSSIYARLTQDVGYISTVASTLMSTVQSTIMMVFTLVYIATISLWSFLIVVTAIGLGVAYYVGFLKYFRLMWKKVSVFDAAFIEKLGHILTGFKEIKINRSKNEGVFNNYKIVNKELKEKRVELNLSYNKVLVFTQVLFYIVLGFILFVLPHFHAEHSEDVIKVTAAVLFIIGPSEGLVSAIRYFDSANSASRNIISLEKQLEELLDENDLDVETQNQPEAYEMLPYTENIEFQNLSYSYPPTKERINVFTVGPVNKLTFRKGELIFITGGNGSGKSTFLKLLTGLYPPETGRIVVDVDLEEKEEEIVAMGNYQQYRNLFSTIFTDFHLFDKLYGVENVNPKAVNKLLVNMGLPQEKVTFENGAFSNLHLSTGQKKRLALTTCIIEDKPIYVFDEVAADLDPEFRDIYYYELLRELKERHKTVIVVSHDRHYWNVPDRILEMDNGALRELSREEIDSLLAIERKATWE